MPEPTATSSLAGFQVATDPRAGFEVATGGRFWVAAEGLISAFNRSNGLVEAICVR